MAFTTTSGNPTKITGTTNVDILSSVDLAGNFIVTADKADDIVTLVSTKDPSQITDVSVYGGDGADTITSPTAQLFRGRTQGGSGADAINYGTVSSYQIYGGKDDDDIDLTLAVNTTVQGSKGNDSIGATGAAAIDASGSKIYGGEGNDKIWADTVTASTIQGSLGNDSITLEGTVSGNSKINGGGDNDTILATTAGMILSKGTTLNGNKGADIITISNSVDVSDITIFGGSGTDTIDAGDNQATVSGDLGEDIISSGNGTKTSISGGGGNDRVTAEVNTAGNTLSINGGSGLDNIDLGKAGITTVMQGRTDSAAATEIAGNYADADDLSDNQKVTFGNQVDVISSGTDATAFDVATDLLGLELTTTIANINFFGRSGGAAINKRNGVAQTGADVLDWGDVKQAGQTSMLSGIYNDADNSFTIGNGANTDLDLMVVQGNGSNLLGNSSVTIIDLETAVAWTNFGVTTTTGITDFIA